MRKLVAVSLAFIGAVAVQAQTAATLPTPTEMTTQITGIAPVAAAAAAVGFSIWMYRKVKAKSNQALG